MNLFFDELDFICARCAGRIVSDSIKDQNSVGITTSGMILHILPTEPSTNSMGENVAIVVSTANTTGTPTSYAPLLAAVLRSTPFSICLYIFSPTITASSTTIPRTRIKVKSDNKLIETSKYGSISSAPINDIGIPSDTQNANLGLRNKASMIKTKNKPSFAFFISRSILPLNIFDSSFQLVRYTPSGSIF